MAKSVQKRRAGLKGSLTVLTSDIDEFLDSASRVEVEARLLSIQKQLDKYEVTQEDLADTYEDAEYIEVIREDTLYMEGIQVIVATLKGILITEVKKEVKKEPKKSAVKLPHLTLSKFEGDATMWSGFWEMFKCTIHDNPDLTDIQRFTYLKGQLQGDAHKLVEGFIIESASYAPAIELLQETYGHPDRIKAAYVTKFNQLVSPKHQTADLKDFYANTESVMRSIISHGICLEEFCVVTLVNKLPSPLKETIKREMGDSSLDYKKFTHCLQAEVYNMAGQDRVGGTPMATATFTAQSEYRKFNCVLCSGTNHLWYKCMKYKTGPLKVKRARQLRLCTGCLSKDHGHSGCTNPNIRSCKFCKGKHFHSLCTQKQGKESRPAEDNTKREHTAATSTTMSVATGKNTVILPTVQLPVKGKDNNCVKIRSLLDQCSQRTFVKSSVLSSLSYISKGTEELCLHGFTGKQASREYNVVALQYKHRGKFHHLDAIVVDELPEHKGEVSLKSKLVSLQSKGIKLADPHATDTDQLELLIGADHYYDIVRPGYKRSGSLILLPTKYGYAISGSYVTQPTSSSTEVITVLKVAVTPMDEYISTGNIPPCKNDLNVLWELDHIGITPKEYSLVERQALSSYEDTVTYDPDSQQYKVRLPWNNSKDQLPSNKGLAIGRLRGLQKRFLKEPDFCEEYSKVIKEQVSRGFIEEVPFDKSDTGHYLAHHGVVKESKTTPVRIVFDCSAKMSERHPSLNDCLYTGPSLVPDLAQVLLRFRLGKYAWVSDIEKAFLMLRLHEDDQDYTRFMWPKYPRQLDSPLICYRFRAVLFGATCSQFLLNATILKHLSYVSADPQIIHQIRSGLYIDNLLGTGNEEDFLVDTYAVVREIMNDAHLHLREWATNNSVLRTVLQRDGVAAVQQEHVRVLGLFWKTDTDTLSFGVQYAQYSQITKRICLSMTAKLFDPLGIVLPVSIKSRLFLQQLWRIKLGWDEVLTGDLVQEWEDIISDLRLCKGFNFPRRVVMDHPVSIHAFSDASKVAYGTAIYFVDTSGSRLVIAKAKVAPIKSLSIPKLELTAVLLAARLVHFVEETFKNLLNISETVIWSDSQITLYWLHSRKKLPVYVTNRVDEIRNLLPTAQFRYVSTKENPSDCITRGVSAKFLKSSALWWNGPCWLNDPNEWPENIDLSEQHTAIVAPVIDSVPDEDTRLWDWDRFSSYEKLQRVTAWVIRFVENVKAKIKGTPPTGSAYLNVKEIRIADKLLHKLCQQEIYTQEYKLLVKGTKSRNNLINQLGLHLKGDLIHCGGRLRLAALSEASKYPILLPPNHPFTHLIIDRCHRLCCHYGVGHIVTYVRQRWWVPRIRQVVKKVLRKCLKCRRVQGTHYDPVGIPPLPNLRTTPGDPYKVTGVDYSGAIPVKDSPNLKVYMILFTCAVTRAIHLELVTNLTCDSFLHAFRRFCSRQGYPRIMLSDNAKTFIGASTYLKEVSNNPKIQTCLADVKCEWRFIPARAPWFGAIWERAIGIVKAGLKKVLGRALISIEELNTILLEIEATVNDRPLYYASGDLEDLTPITPSVLVRGYRLRDLPEEHDEDTMEDPDYISKEVISARYKYIRKLSRDIWHRWSTEYLVTLREAQRNKLTPLKGHWPRVGDVVTIHEEGPRAFWKLGRIEELLPGRDGEVRVAKVRTRTGVITRPTVRLYPLEGDLDRKDTPSDQLSIEVPSLASTSAQPVDASGERPRRQAAQISSQAWRDKIASGQI